MTLSDGIALLASDGLSDPFIDGGPSTGFGAEVYLASAVLAPGLPSDHTRTWQFSALHGVTQNIVAGAGMMLGPMIGEHGLGSMGLHPTGAPEDWLDDDAGMGVLLGSGLPGVPESITVDGEVVQFVGVVPLRPDELALILQEGPEARRRIADALRLLSPAGLTSPERPSVFPLG